MSEIYEMSIRGFAFGGAAFGNLPDGKLCFVRGAVPGERVRIEITVRKKNFANARLLEVLEPSPERIEPECPYAVRAPDTGNACPGCSYEHVPYEMELVWKQQQFESFLTRPGLISKEKILPPFQSPSRYHWRNRIKLACEMHGNTLSFGYRGEDNRSLIEIQECPLARKGINALLTAVRANLPEPSKIKQLNFRWTQQDGALFWINNNVPSEKLLTEKLGDFGTFAVPCSSFFQTNPAVACELARRVVKTLEKLGTEFLAELYCGVGVFSIIAAKQLKRLKTHGIEMDKLASACARQNALRVGVPKRCRFETADASASLPAVMKGKNPETTVILLDPPRSGLDKHLLEDLRNCGAKHLLYISCSPDTLQRDLKTLCSEGPYELLEAGLLDMFPATAHFESLSILRRQ